MKKALVTGICGFIGSHLACVLAANGIQVIGVDVRCESLNPGLMKLIEDGTVTVHKGDLLGFDFSSLGSVDFVYQVAGKVSAWGELSDFDRVNVDGTRRVIDYAKAAGSRVFVYLSSVAVYGYRGYRDLPEEGEKKPMENPYSLSKLHAETMVADHCREIGLDYLVIRPGNVYGEYDMTSSYDLYRLVAKGKMAVVDHGRYLSCFVYAGNLAEGIYRASITESAYNEDYNLTDGGGETLAKYLACVAEALGVKPRFISLPGPLSILTARCIEGFYRLMRSKTMPMITLFSVESLGGTGVWHLRKRQSPGKTAAERLKGGKRMNSAAKNTVKTVIFVLAACALAAAVAVADALFQKVADLFAGGSGFAAAAWYPAAKHLIFLALCCGAYAVIIRRRQIKDFAKALLIAAPASAAYIAAGSLFPAHPAFGYTAGAVILAGFLLYFIIKKKTWMYYVSVSLSFVLLLVLSLAGSA